MTASDLKSRVKYIDDRVMETDNIFQFNRQNLLRVMKKIKLRVH
jgi:hypothetical protein